MPNTPINTDTTGSATMPNMPPPVDMQDASNANLSSQTRIDTTPNKPTTVAPASKTSKTSQPSKTKKPRTHKGTPRGTEHKPEVVKKIVAQVVAATGSTHQAAGLLGLAPSTVQSILTRSIDQLSDAKKSMAAKCLVLGEKAAELAAQKLPEVRSPIEAATIMGIALDKSVKLTEQASPLVALQINAVGELSDALKLIQSAPANI